MTKSARALAEAPLPSKPRLPTSQTQLDGYLPYLLNRLVYRWNTEQNRFLNDYGINGTTFRALSSLFIHETLTVNDIASYAFVEQSNASRTIDSMVAAGLVQRRVSKDDLRRREIILTKKGEDLLKRLWPLWVRNYQVLVDGISNKALQDCTSTLSEMAEHLDRID